MSAQPNILFFFPDQHRHDWLGCNENLPLRTPNLDRLMQKGSRFTRTYCNSPVCAPSRAALATGRYYDRCGVVHNGMAMPLDMPTFYQSLRAGGYRVCGVGKFDLDKPDLHWNLDGSLHLAEWGFTEGVDNEGKFDGSRSYMNNSDTPQGPYLKALHDAGMAGVYCQEHRVCKEKRDAYTTALPDELYCDNWLSDLGREYIRNFPAGQPWFIQVNFTGPHNPMDVTASMRARWENVEFPPPHQNGENHYSDEDHQRNRQNYAAMIENIDRQVGLFIEEVEKRGELDNTLIVYASDHGEMLGDHSRWGKSIWYEPSVGVPLIVSGPGVESGKVKDTLVEIHDLASTFIDYAGSAALPSDDSKSLRPVLEGRASRHREYAVSGLHEFRTAVSARYKYVDDGEGRELLFDLENDPLEDCNIIADHPLIAEELKKVIESEK
ncbi:MAG: sulfatase-like hydrolase/transferase [Planctomycetes bacterium]|nr:sulfatase-like hydrolase/transferase [Planctomycetota bacterium]